MANGNALGCSTFSFFYALRLRSFTLHLTPNPFTLPIATPFGMKLAGLVYALVRMGAKIIALGLY